MAMDNEPGEQKFGFDEYSKRLVLEKAKRAPVARDLFLLAMLFLVASGASLFWDRPWVAAGLFSLFVIVNQVASETRLEIAMLDANTGLALLVRQQARDLEALRGERRGEQDAQTR